MKIGIIGAGFIGLSVAQKLTKQGFDVTVLEKENLPGGLALGFKETKWKWFLEHHYHHIFTSDNHIRKLAKEVGVKILFKKPKTKSLVEENIYPLNSPTDVLLFSKLSLFQRLRMGIILTFLKLNPFWKPLEKITAEKWLKKYMGEKAFNLLWNPLLKAKFGEYKDQISLAWFWARIKKRSSSLGYPVGGFQNLAEKIVEKTKKNKGKFYFGTEVKEIKKGENGTLLVYSNDTNHRSGNQRKFIFDKVIVTLPSFIFLKITKGLTDEYIEKLEKLKMLSALNLVLILKKPFFQDNTYWLNICDNQFPFLSVVEHTNFINKSFYNNEHLVYVGNYLTFDHPYFKLSAEQLLKIYTPFLKKINPNFHLSSFISHLFKAPFAQPIIPLNYSKIIPPFETPIKNLYLANMQQVYPWDRGTNYAVELGERIAEMLTQQLNNRTI